MMKLAINLLWLRPGKVGGTESYTRNLLDGFLVSDYDYQIYLICSSDNKDSFIKYQSDARFTIVDTGISNINVARRIFWENLKFGKLLTRLGLHLCFIPVYSKPVIGCSKIHFIVTIHDLQHIHFPRYFSKIENLWMRFIWKQDVNSGAKIVAISNYVKRDIIENFNAPDKQVQVIYNPIVINSSEICSFGDLKKKYGITDKSYYFTVSQLRPHKNLNTILGVLQKIKEEKMDIPAKWIISGVGGKSTAGLISQITELELNNNVILAGFISNRERNTLYRHCYAFLFPSIFEGFGMPPIEAMYMGCPVITTKETSIPEVTHNKAYYVDDPFSQIDWIQQIKDCRKRISSHEEFPEYRKDFIAKQYLDLFSKESNKYN